METNSDSEDGLSQSIRDMDPWFQEGYEIGHRAAQREVTVSKCWSYYYRINCIGSCPDQFNGQVGDPRRVWESP